MDVWVGVLRGVGERALRPTENMERASERLCLLHGCAAIRRCAHASVCVWLRILERNFRSLCVEPLAEGRREERVFFGVVDDEMYAKIWSGLLFMFFVSIRVNIGIYALS